MQYKTSHRELSFVLGYLTLKERKANTSVSSRKLQKLCSENLIFYSLVAKSSDAKYTFTPWWSKVSWESYSSVPSLSKKTWIISSTYQRLVSLGFSNSKNESFRFINWEMSADKSIKEYFCEYLHTELPIKSETWKLWFQ